MKLYWLAGLALWGCHGGQAEEPISATVGISAGEDRWKQTIDFRAPKPVGVHIVADRPIGDLEPLEGTQGAVAVHIELELSRRLAGSPTQYTATLSERPVDGSSSNTDSTTASTGPIVGKEPLGKLLRSEIATELGSLPVRAKAFSLTGVHGESHSVRIELVPVDRE